MWTSSRCGTGDKAREQANLGREWATGATVPWPRGMASTPFAPRPPFRPSGAPRQRTLASTGRLCLAHCVVLEGWPLAPGPRRGTVPGLGVHGHTVGRPLPHHRRGRAWPTTPHGRTTAPAAPRPVPNGGSSNCGYCADGDRPAAPNSLGLHTSTVHHVLTRYRQARLTHLDRATGRVVRRYERSQPGELVHVDIKKLGDIPDGGGYLFAAAGITVQRVLTDNGAYYKSHLWRDTLTAAGISHKRTRPDRPARRLPQFPALLQPSPTPHRDRRPPATRVPNLSGQYT